MKNINFQSLAVLTGAVAIIFFFAFFTPAQKGEQIGATAANAVSEKMNYCWTLDDTNRGGCYRDIAYELAEDYSFPDLAKAIAQREDEPAVFGKCHELGHYLGREAFRHFGDVPKAFQNVSPVCHGGMYHGVMEGYMADKNITLVDIESDLNYIINHACDGTEEIGGLYGVCLHGLGHGVMFLTQNDLPLSLSFCDLLSSEGTRSSCYTGAFMENSSSSTEIGHPSVYVDPDDPNYPCKILGEQHQKICYLFQASYFHIVHGFNFEKTFQACKEIPESYQIDCFRGVGGNAVGNFQEPEEIANACNKAFVVSKDAHRYCIEGVIRNLVERHSGKQKPVENFCALVEKDYKETCYKMYGNDLRGWVISEEERQKECGEFSDSQHRKWCIETMNY